MSHVVPSFVFRWLRKTSVTGHLRSTDVPNRRAQDGAKIPLLCAACETRLSGWEKTFCERIFEPYCSSSSTIVRYDEWLLKFCVSLSWRTYHYFNVARKIDHLTEFQNEQLLSAIEVWRKFLLDECPHPGKFRQYLLPCDLISEVNGSPLIASNINRYLARGVNIDLPAGDSSAFVMTKIPRFILLGCFQLDPELKFVGCEVRVRHGWIMPREYDVPSFLWEYLNHKAKTTARKLDQMSATQKLKIENEFRAKDLIVSQSDLWRAVAQDLQFQNLWEIDDEE